VAKASPLSKPFDHVASAAPAGAADAPRRLIRRLGRVALYLAFPVSVLVVWQILAVAGLYRRAILPPPTDIAVVWYDLITGVSGEAGRYSGTWWDHALASLWRVYAGFAWSVALGVTVGLLIGLSRVVEKVFDPTIQVLRNVPVTAWVPLSLIFFGIGNEPAIFLIGLGAFFPAAINATHGVRQVNRTLYKAAQMMGTNNREMLFKVVLPAALPSIMTGVRLSMGIAWVLVVVAEILAVRSGLGYLLNDAYQFYRNDVVIASMLSIGILGYLSDQLVVMLRDRVLEWNRLESFGG
jgi:NitT/TauT family transport system permease protein